MKPLASLLPSFDTPAPVVVVAPEPVIAAEDHGPRGMGFCIWVQHPNRAAGIFQLVETREQADEVLRRKQRLVRLTESKALFFATPYADHVKEQG